jgi:hypothetical protein
VVLTPKDLWREGLRRYPWTGKWLIPLEHPLGGGHRVASGDAG